MISVTIRKKENTAFNSIPLKSSLELAGILWEHVNESILEVIYSGIKAMPGK